MTTDGESEGDRLRCVASGVSLRPITGTDLPFLFQVYVGTRAAELAPVPWPDEQKAAFLAMQFDAQHRHYQQHYPAATFMVVLVDGEPAGRLYLNRASSEIRIVDIALLGEYQGRGIGTHLVRAIGAESRERGCPVRIHVERENPALAWYQREGFRLLEDRGVYLFMERQPDALPPT